MLSLPSLVCAAALCAVASPPHAPWSAPPTTVPPLFFSEIVAKSHVIVTATVTASESRYENDKKTIRTYVTLGNLMFAKGPRSATLELRFEGGQIGEDRLEIADMPKLEVGKRYMLYVDGTRDVEKVSPVVGFHQGCFEITQRAGREVLLNISGQELIGVVNDRFTFRAAPPKQRRDPGDVPAEVAPIAGEENHEVKMADPNAEALEARILVERMREAQRARASARVPVLDASAPAVAADDARPVANAPKQELRDRSLALPLVIRDASVDPGTRVTVSDLLRIGGR